MTNVSGCDSILTINATIGHVSEETITESTCENELVINGITYTETGVFNQILNNASGCDSTLILNLMIGLESDTVFDSQLICDELVEINGYSYTSTGLYTQTLINTQGCDSVMVFDLQFGIGDSIYVDTVICGQNIFTYQDFEMFTDGTYEVFDTTVMGCPTVSVINVAFESSFTVSVEQVGTTLISNPNSGIFQWYNCTDDFPIPGENNNYFNPSINGEYYVKVTQNGCTYKSDCISTFGIGIEEINKEIGFQVFPNPNQGTMTVQLSEYNTYQKLKIITPLGSEIFYLDHLSELKSIPLQLNVASGVYYIQMLSKTNQWESKKVIIQ